MSKKELYKRYFIFMLGLFVSSLGVAMITKTDLGTSPISAIPYVLSLYYPLTLGEFTIAFSLLLIAVQFLLLRKHFKWIHLLQIPVSVVFGYFIDFGMFLLGFVQPDIYMWKVFYLLMGCIILGIGVYGEILANVVMLPGESFVRAVVFVWNKDFGSMKILFNVSMTVVAAALSYLLIGKIAGVREGTVVAALLVGFMARFIGEKMSFLPEKLFGAFHVEAENIEAMISDK